MMRELARRARANLAGDRGETLVETLVSTLILAGVVLMLLVCAAASAFLYFVGRVPVLKWIMHPPPLKRRKPAPVVV